jgi:hypothetical protein
MARDMPPGEETVCLKALGISLLGDWDVLVFLWRHGAMIASTGRIARLVGYETTVAGDSLDRLEALGLVRRSRASQGLRLFQFAIPADPVLRERFEQLRALAESRAGRLRVLTKLKKPARSANSRGAMVSISRGEEARNV